jgi:hypothetical protein
MVDTHLMAKHWFEIEKRMDLEANNAQLQLAHMLKALDKYSEEPELKPFVKRLIDEHVSAYDLFRTISVVASDARRRCEVEEQ